MKIILSEKAKTKKEMVEEHADFAHSAWSGWMKYLFSKSTSNKDGSETIPKDLVDRWKRQLKTDYKDLTEDEKESDRDEAKKVLKIVQRYLNENNYI